MGFGKASFALLLVFTQLAAACSQGAPGGGASTAGAGVSAPASQPAASASRVAPLSPAVSVKVATIGAINDAGFYLALERGYFKEEGLEVELLSFKSSLDMVAPMGTGELEVGSGAPNPGIFNAITRGIPLRIVGDKGSYVGTCSNALVIRKDLVDSGQFKDFADLKGRTIAVTSLAVANYIDSIKALEKANLTKDDANITALGFPDMNLAFTNRSIDAAMHFEPFLSDGLEKGLFVKFKCAEEIYPSHQYAILVYSPHFVEKKPEAARRLMVGYLRGVRDYVDAFAKGKDKRAVIDVLTRNTPIKDAQVYERMAYVGLDPDGRVNRTSIANDQDMWQQLGVIQTKVDLDKVIDNSFVEYAISRLGRYQR